jgi:predicted dehydrogenase
MRFIDGPVKWGILGCGDVCEVKSGPAFHKIPDSSLVAVMRRDLTKARDFAMRHKVPTYYNDATLLINDPNVNAIYVATPPDSHEALAIEAMKSGKPVYIEKPVATNTEGCKNMITTAGRLKVPVTVAHYRRHLALFERIKSLIAEQAIGEVRMVILNLFQAPKPSLPAGSPENWRVNPKVSGGGLLFDLAPHQLDIMYWIFGTPSKWQSVSINQRRAYSAPDVTSMTAVFGSNIFFHGLWSFSSPSHAIADSVKIIGDTGTLEFPFFASFEETKLQMYLKDGHGVEKFIFPEHIQQPMIEHVVNFFRGKASNPCSLEEALVTLRMIEDANK